MERVGYVTASRFADVLAISKRDGKPLKAREDYLMNLVCERLTGEPTLQQFNFAMEWGTEAEPYARKAYEMCTGNLVKEVGFKKHPSIEWVGASSDGLVNSDGGIEIKCPYNSNIHLKTIENCVPEEHLPQIYGQMWILDLKWVDFISYDPRMLPHLRLFYQRIERCENYIDDLRAGVVKFLEEVAQKVTYFHGIPHDK